MITRVYRFQPAIVRARHGAPNGSWRLPCRLERIVQ